MPVSRLIDVAVQAMVVLLKAELPGVLTSIDAEYGDGIVSRPPRLVLDFEPSSYEIPDTPVVMVLPGRTRFLADTGFAQGGWADAQHELQLVALLEDSAPRSLSRRLIRYQRGMMEVAGAHRVGVLDGNGRQAWNGLSILSTTPGNRFHPDSDPSQYGDTTTIMLRVTRTEA